MDYKHKETRANSDDTYNYDIIGEFPVTFREFSKRILADANSFRVQFAATNKCYGGWLGNRLEVHKPRGADTWYLTKQEPENWLNEIANKNIIKCWANGGWGQMTYFVTFEEEDNNKEQANDR